MAAVVRDVGVLITGPPPVGEAAPTFVHTQTVPATVWGPIAHNLGYRPPAVSLFSADYGTEYTGFAVQHLNANELRISMDIPVAGIALIG